MQCEVGWGGGGGVKLFTWLSQMGCSSVEIKKFSIHVLCRWNRNDTELSRRRQKKWDRCCRWSESLSFWHLIERNHSLTAYQGEKWESVFKGADEDRQDKWGTLHIIHHSAGLKVKLNVLMCDRVMEQVMTAFHYLKVLSGRVHWFRFMHIGRFCCLLNQRRVAEPVFIGSPCSHWWH